MRERAAGLIAIFLILALFVLAAYADAPSGMMGVGTMLQGGAGAGPAPETFYLTNDSGQILTNDAGTNRITTQ